MKHNAFTALSLAAALVVAGSAEASEFSMNFETGTALPGTEGTWTVPSGDASAVVATPSGAPNDCGTQVLSLDTGDDELNYAPTSTDVSILTMDVCFVGADSVPATTGFTGQTMVYLDVTDAQNPALKAYVGTGWQTISTAVTDGSWHTLKMTFDYSNGTVKFKVGSEDETAAFALPGTPSDFTQVTSVGFKGTGFIDNFVGDKGGISGYTDDGTGENAGNAVAFENGVVTGSFAMDDLKFIRVYNGNNYVANFGTPTKVVAYYGNSVTATTGVTPTASAVAVDTTTGNISITVPNAESGLYYTPFGPDGKALANSVEILPQNHGDPATLSVPAATDWGVVKFQIVASDEAYRTNDPLQSNN